MKKMLYSMSGPKIRAIVNEMISMTSEEREARMKSMKTKEMQIIAGVLKNCSDRLDRIFEVILWDKGDGQGSLEVKSARG